MPRKSHSGAPRTAAVITVSDGCSRGLRKDLSGPAVARTLDAHGFRTVLCVTVPDERKSIEDALRHAAGVARLVVTTGGTGVAERDVTPEATRAVCDRLIDGIAELMRAEGRRETPLATLSRGVCGILSAKTGPALILNVPGSPAGAVSSLRAALPVLPHALDLLDGKTEHRPAGEAEAQFPHNAKPAPRPAVRGHSNKGKG